MRGMLRSMEGCGKCGECVGACRGVGKPIWGVGRGVESVLGWREVRSVGVWEDVGRGP